MSEHDHHCMDTKTGCAVENDRKSVGDTRCLCVCTACQRTQMRSLILAYGPAGLDRRPASVVSAAPAPRWIRDMAVANVLASIRTMTAEDIDRVRAALPMTVSPWKPTTSYGVETGSWERLWVGRPRHEIGRTGTVLRIGETAATVEKNEEGRWEVWIDAPQAPADVPTFHDTPDEGRDACDARLRTVGVVLGGNHG